MRRGAGRDDDVPPIPEIPEFLRGRSYLNFEESATGSRSFYDEVTDRHLRRIKTQVDPGDIFMSNPELWGGVLATGESALAVLLVVGGHPGEIRLRRDHSLPHRPAREEQRLVSVVGPLDEIGRRAAVATDLQYLTVTYRLAECSGRRSRSGRHLYRSDVKNQDPPTIEA